MIVTTLDRYRSVGSHTIATADLPVGCRAAPHIDQRDRAVNAAPLARRVADGDTAGRSTPHLARLPFERIERPVSSLDEFDPRP